MADKDSDRTTDGLPSVVNVYFVGRWRAVELADQPADVLIFATADDKHILPVWVELTADRQGRPSSAELLATILGELSDGFIDTDASDEDDAVWSAEFSTYTRGRFTATLSFGRRSFDAQPRVLEALSQRGILREIQVGERARVALVSVVPGLVKGLRSEVQKLQSDDPDDLQADPPRLSWDMPTPDTPTRGELSEEEIFQQLMSEMGDFGELGDND